MIGQFAQRGLLHAFGGWIHRCERFLQFRRAEIALHAILRVDHLCAVFSAFGFAIGQHPATGGETVFHCGAEVEKAHGENAGAITDLTGHHPASAEGDIAVQHFAFYGGINARQQFANRVQVRAVFVTQREVEQKVLHGVQANFRQFTALRCANAGQRIEWDGIQ